MRDVKVGLGFGRRRVSRKEFLLLLTGACTGLVAACGQASSPTQAPQQTQTQPTQKAQTQPTQQPQAAAAPAKLTTLKAVVGDSLANLPVTYTLRIADVKRLWEQEGLEVERPQLQTNTAIPSMLNGQVQFFSSGVSSMYGFPGQVKVIAGTYTRKAANLIVVGPRVQTVQDLKGKVLGVTGLAQISHGLFLVVLQKYGISTDDVTFQPVPNGVPGYVAGMTAGSLDAVPIAPPGQLQVMSAVPGAKVLLSMGDLLPQFAGIALMAPTTVLSQQPELVRRVVRVHTRAVAWMRDPKNLDEFAGYISSDLKAPLEDSKTGVQQSYDSFGYILSQEAWDASLRPVILAGGLKTPPSYSDGVDMTFQRAALQELGLSDT